MTGGDVVGGVIVAVASGATIAAITRLHRMIIRSAVRGLISALDRHTVEKLDPRFDVIEGRLDDQDHVLDLQSQAIADLKSERTVVPFRRTAADGRR